MNNQIDSTTIKTTLYLPEYIQKYIIRIISEKLNNDLNVGEYISDTYEDQMNMDIKSVSMVNKLWFNSISNNLNVSNDFLLFRHEILKDIRSRKIKSNLHKKNESNHFIVKRLIKQQQQQQQQQQSTTITINNRLLKDENVTELILNMDQWGIEISISDLPELLFKLINYTIKNRYINLKRISISNTDNIWILNQIEFNYIRITSFFSNCTPIPTNIKEFGCLYIDGYNDYKVPINEAYKFFINLNSITMFNYSSVPKFIKTLYETLSTAITVNNNNNNNIINCFSKTYMISSPRFTIGTIEDLYYILKLAPNLKYIMFSLCIDNINYQLTKKQSGRACSCCNQNKNESFMLYWNNVIQMLADNKPLNSFKMVHKCSDQRSYHDEEVVSKSISNVFIDQFSSIFKSNKSISHLELKNFDQSRQFIQKINNNSNGLRSFVYNGIDIKKS